jgi:hypothetical protein
VRDGCSDCEQGGDGRGLLVGEVLGHFEGVAVCDGDCEQLGDGSGVDLEQLGVCAGVSDGDWERLEVGAAVTEAFGDSVAGRESVRLRDWVRPGDRDLGADGDPVTVCAGLLDRVALNVFAGDAERVSLGQA